MGYPACRSRGVAYRVFKRSSLRQRRCFKTLTPIKKTNDNRLGMFHLCMLLLLTIYSVKAHTKFKLIAKTNIHEQRQEQLREKYTAAKASNLLAYIHWQQKVVKYSAATLPRMNLSRYVEHVTIFIWMLTIACCLVIGLGFWLWL